MESSKLCRKCDNQIESDRPKWCRYCKECGSHRSRDWKREHPERTKLHGADQANLDWRDRNEWNAYIRAWREQHHAKYRDQNTRHVREHRSRNHKSRAAAMTTQSTVIVGGLAILVLAVQGCGSLPKLDVSVETLNHFDWFLVRLTATFTLAAACLRLIFHDVARLISEARRRRLESHPSLHRPRD